MEALFLRSHYWFFQNLRAPQSWTTQTQWSIIVIIMSSSSPLRTTTIKIHLAFHFLLALTGALDVKGNSLNACTLCRKLKINNQSNNAVEVGWHQLHGNKHVKTHPSAWTCYQYFGLMHSCTRILLYLFDIYLIFAWSIWYWKCTLTLVFLWSYKVSLLLHSA